MCDICQIFCLFLSPTSKTSSYAILLLNYLLLFFFLHPPQTISQHVRHTHLCIPEAKQHKWPCAFSSSFHILFRLKYFDTVSRAWDQFSQRSKARVTPSSPLLSFLEVWIDFHWPWHSSAWDKPSQGSAAFPPLSRFAPLLPDCGKVQGCEFTEEESSGEI